MNPQIISALLDTGIAITFLIIIGKIAANTKTTNEYLEYIITKIREDEENKILNEIEEELSLTKKELDKTHQ